MVNFDEIIKRITVLIMYIAHLIRDLLIRRRELVYLKMDPPADTDKPGVANPPIGNDNSCWMATAANMLAAAGYGNGATLQARADDIYADLITWQTDPATNPTGREIGGWIDTAITWWLNSGNNSSPNNPYKVVTVYGNKSPKFPWADSNGARFTANELRHCHLVGLSISWPTDEVVPITGIPIIGSGGHAITCWGDNGDSNDQTNNPGIVRVTDSDTDIGGNIQSYNYDVYTNPNPGGPNEGNGWYINYDNNHPYIKHIVTLSPTDIATDNVLTQKVVGSFTIHQSSEKKATDLHYKVGTDTDILTYKTYISWGTANRPRISEDAPRRNLNVDWDLSDKPVPYCTNVKITTEFILPYFNAIKYENVGFTYPDGLAIIMHDLRWEMITPILENASRIPNVTGGYVVGSFDIKLPGNEAGNGPMSEYRFVHEYSYNQDPEKHILRLTGCKGIEISNIRVGHTYGYPTNQELWEFKKWMTESPGKNIVLSKDPYKVEINWKGLLPYPPGEDITGRIKEKKDALRKPDITKK